MASSVSTPGGSQFTRMRSGSGGLSGNAEQEPLAVATDAPESEALGNVLAPPDAERLRDPEAESGAVRLDRGGHQPGPVEEEQLPAVGSPPRVQEAAPFEICHFPGPGWPCGVTSRTYTSSRPGLVGLVGQEAAVGTERAEMLHGRRREKGHRAGFSWLGEGQQEDVVAPSGPRRVVGEEAAVGRPALEVQAEVLRTRAEARRLPTRLPASDRSPARLDDPRRRRCGSRRATRPGCSRRGGRR